MESGEKEYKIEKIIDVRVVWGNQYFLVKWKGYADYNNTWVAE